MESRAVKIYAPRSKKVSLTVIPGHFATSQSHINLYIDLTSAKTKLSEASEVARILAMQYMSNVVVETIVCMDNCEVVGAFLAHELTQATIISMNYKQAINIISPEFNTNGQMIFTENIQPIIQNKQVLLLNSTATTGDTIRKSLDGIRYYGGIISGICAIFSAVEQVEDIPIYSIFKAQDLPDYHSFNAKDCPMCKDQEKLEAIVNGYGYMKL